MTNTAVELNVISPLESGVDEVIAFMQSVDSYLFRLMISYFSVPGKYCGPREVMLFWKSLTEDEKHYYRWAIWEVRW